MYSVKSEPLVCEEVDLGVEDASISMPTWNEETEEDLQFPDNEDPLATSSVKKEEMELAFDCRDEDRAVFDENAETEMTLLNPESIVKQEMDGNSTGVDNASKKSKRSEKRVYICTLCNVGFPNDKFYQEHISEIHADEFPFPCRHCGKRFQGKQHRKYHETIHDSKRFEGEPKFACDLCDKRYYLKVSLVGHRKKTHLGYKPTKRPGHAAVIEHHAKGTQAPRKPKVKEEIPCPQCDLVFSMKCTLKRHMLVHSSDLRYPCPFCDALLKSHKSLPGHIKRVHKTERIGPRPSRPKSMAHQPCPCPVCGKVFRIPSQLKRHVTVHTGEKCHKCRTCGMDFRLKSDLYRHEKRHVSENDVTQKFKLHLHKCIYCGKDFAAKNDLRGHRIGKHRNIPVLDSEKEKGPFGCVVCGKPWNTRAGAIICNLYRHDPSSLLKTMFRFKCEECPKESLINGYHSLVALRKHWSTEHPQLPIPAKYRAGMYNENLSDALPTVTIPKAKAAEVRDGSLFLEMDEEQVESLYLELDLVQVDEKFLLKKIRRPRATKKREEKPKPYCGKCSMSFSKNFNYRRHMKVKHRINVKLNDMRRIAYESSNNTDSDKVSGERVQTSSVVIESRPKVQKGLKGRRSRRIRKRKKCKEDIIGDLGGDVKKRNDTFSVCMVKTVEAKLEFRCNICEKAFATKRAAQCHELRSHRRKRIKVGRPKGGKVASREYFDCDDDKRSYNPSDSNGSSRCGPGTVNVNDQAGINALLGWKEAWVKLFRITFKVNLIPNYDY